MTTLAIIADVHGNLPALEAVIKGVRDEADVWLCAGDIAGHLPMVDEVVARLRSIDAKCVAGNHDRALVNHQAKVDSLAATWVLRKQQEYVLEASKSFLAALPETLELEHDGFRIVMMHGGPANPLTHRVDTVNDELLASFSQDILVVGHRHRPMVHIKGRKAVLNPGAVGLPVDGEKRARVMLVDLPSLHVRVREFDYDRAALFRQMRQVGYDERYFNCLEAGRWVGFSDPCKRVPVLVIGAAIYGEIVAELIEKTPDKYVVGFVDDTPALQNKLVAGCPVLGKVSELDQIAREAGITEIAVAIGDNTAREKVSAMVKSLGLRLTTLVHPSAHVSPSAKLAAGVMVDALAYIGPHCVLEEGVCIWPSVSISHDTLIKRYTAIKPSAVVGGCSVIDAGLKIPLGSRWSSYSTITAQACAAQSSE